MNQMHTTIGADDDDDDQPNQTRSRLATAPALSNAIGYNKTNWRKYRKKTWKMKY